MVPKLAPIDPYSDRNEHAQRQHLRRGRAHYLSIAWSNLRSFDLRFCKYENECAYVRDNLNTLLRAALISSGLFTCALVSHLLALYWDEFDREDTPMRPFDFEDVRSVHLFSSAFFLMMNTLYSLCLIATLAYGMFEQCNWEMIISVKNSILIFGIVLCGCMEHNPQWIRKTNSESMELGLLVAIDTIITASCLFLPIRTCILWIVPFSATACFVGMHIFVGMHESLNRMNIFILFCLGVFSLAGSFRHEKHSRKDWLLSKEVEKQSKQNEVQHAGACRILDTLCDALVEVDSEYRIRNPNVRFAALLLRSNAQSLEGANFCDYLSSDDDRQRFVSALQNDHSVTKKSSGAHGGMVQLSLRDTTRAFVAYVYHSPVFDSRGERGHMMAIVEAQERAPPPNTYDLPPLNASNSFDDFLVPSTGSGFSSVESIVSIESGSPEEILAWLEVGEDGDPILSRRSVGFSVFGPIQEGTNLCDLVFREKRNFREWFQNLVNCKMNNVTDKPIEPLSLRLRTSPTANFEFAAKCKPHLESSQEDDKVVCIMFSDVKTVKRRRKIERRPPSLRGEAQTNHILICL